MINKCSCLEIKPASDEPYKRFPDTNDGVRACLCICWSVPLPVALCTMATATRGRAPCPSQHVPGVPNDRAAFMYLLPHLPRCLYRRPSSPALKVFTAARVQQPSTVDRGVAGRTSMAGDPRGLRGLLMLSNADCVATA